MASVSGRIDIVKLLLEYNALKKVPSSHGKMAIDFAQSFKHDEIAALLQ